MEDLLEYVVKKLVVNKTDVVIRTEETDDSVTLYICVNDDDRGMVIGKDGSVLAAIRSIIETAATGKPKRYTVELADKTPTEKPSEAEETTLSV